jgi:hypothetical protein
MNILTVENTAFDLNTVPDEIDDIRYCVLDISDKRNIDFYFLPLVFLESFHSTAICLEIGPHHIQLPMDWSILVCDDDFSALEIIGLASLNNRGFRAVSFNPMTSRSMDNEPISITNIYQDVKWYFPKLKPGHMLAIPLETKPNPRCAYFIKETTKIPDLDVGDFF